MKHRRQITIKAVPREEHFEHHDDEWGRLSMEERLGLMWPLAKDFYGITDEDESQSRVSRHALRIIRRER